MELLASFRTTIQVDLWHKIPFHFSRYSSHEGRTHTIHACMDRELGQYPGFLRRALPLMHWFTLNNFNLAIVMNIYGCTLSPKKQTKQNKCMITERSPKVRNLVQAIVPRSNARESHQQKRHRLCMYWTEKKSPYRCAGCRCRMGTVYHAKSLLLVKTRQKETRMDEKDKVNCYSLTVSDRHLLHLR